SPSWTRAAATSCSPKSVKNGTMWLYDDANKSYIRAVMDFASSKCAITLPPRHNRGLCVTVIPNREHDAPPRILPALAHLRGTHHHDDLARQRFLDVVVSRGAEQQIG